MNTQFRFLAGSITLAAAAASVMLGRMAAEPALSPTTSQTVPRHTALAATLPPATPSDAASVAPAPLPPMPGANERIAAELAALLRDAVQSDDWSDLIAAIATEMQERPVELVTALLAQGGPLEEMRTSLLHMALERCPAGGAHAVADVLLAKCEDKALQTAALGTLLTAVARLDLDQAAALIPLAIRDGDAAQTLGRMTGALVESHGRQGIEWLAGQVAGRENGTAVLAAAVAHLGSSDARAALQSIDGFAAGASSTALSTRSEAALAAAPALIATGRAVDLAQWMREKSSGMFSAESWSELCSMLASVGSGEAMRLAGSVSDAAARAALEERVRAIATGADPAPLVIESAALATASREPVPHPDAATSRAP